MLVDGWLMIIQHGLYNKFNKSDRYGLGLTLIKAIIRYPYNLCCFHSLKENMIDPYQYIQSQPTVEAIRVAKPCTAPTLPRETLSIGFPPRVAAGVSGDCIHEMRVVAKIWYNMINIIAALFTYSHRQPRVGNRAWWIWILSHSEHSASSILIG